MLLLAPRRRTQTAGRCPDAGTVPRSRTSHWAGCARVLAHPSCWKLPLQCFFDVILYITVTKVSCAVAAITEAVPGVSSAISKGGVISFLELTGYEHEQKVSTSVSVQNCKASCGVFATLFLDTLLLHGSSIVLEITASMFL